MPPCLRAFRQGFTLTELLVVIVIMTILLVIAVPAFNYMTGSRSIEAAQNLAGAMVQRARNAALANAAYCGVFFYEDPVSRRTTMTIVQVSQPSNPDYKAWQPGVTYQGPVGSQHGDRVTYVTQDGNFGNKPITYLWEALQDNPTSHPPDSISPGTPFGSNYPSAYKNADWKVVAPGDTTPLDADDINAGTQQLPSGVRIQVIVQSTFSGATQISDGYMTTGLILFDPQGHLNVNHEFRIQADTTVGQAMKLAAVAPSLYSGIGLAVYDRAAFEANHPATTENGVTIDAFKASDGDGIYTPPFLMNPDGNMNPPYDVNRFNTDEINEEKWLDQNAVRIMIGRSNGVLMGGTP